MKTIVVLLVLLSHLAVGQLPIAVDNSKWFPPVRSQEAFRNCTHFSLIYYLKSSIWNRKFNRDPKLEENQFNHNFVFFQDMNPIYSYAGVEQAYYWLKDQGCATIADFPFNEKSSYLKPDLKIKEKALAYKSKNMFKSSFFKSVEDYDPAHISKKIESLKDSLFQGKSFILDIDIYKDFNNLTAKNNVYSYSEQMIASGFSYNHEFTVVGYNDTIKTVHGRGAFQVINSYEEPAGGKIYLDYNWFLLSHYNSTCYFLEEDFSSESEIVANIQIRNALSGEDIATRNYFFVDTVLSMDGKKFDFVDNTDYLCVGNHIQVIAANGRKIKLRENVLLKPLNNLDGNYELISDLNDLSHIANFKNISLILFDPISANYVGQDGQSFYSYRREAKAMVEKAYISLVGTDKKIVAKIKDLPDTTIVKNDFYSIPGGFNLKPGRDQVFVKSCTSVLKRNLITFSIEDLKTDTPPVWVNTPTSNGSVYENATYSFQFKAQDGEDSPITYSVVSGGDGASVDPVSGLFSYKSSKAGVYDFTVRACDGISDIFTTFSVKILSNTLPHFTSEPASIVTMEAGREFKFKFVAIDPQGKSITYHVASANAGTINPVSGEYSYTPNTLGSIRVEVWAMNGVVNIPCVFTITVIPATNTAPVFLEQPITIDGMVNKDGEYQLEASDKENDPLTFAIVNPLPGVSVSRDGKINYKLPFGTYKFSVKVSDGKDSSIASVTAKIDATDAAPEIQEADYAVRVYPNPIRSNANIEVFMKKSATATITIIDLSGRQVDMMQAECVAGKNDVDYDASSLRSGTYICKVSAADFQKTLKIVKQ